MESNLCSLGVIKTNLYSATLVADWTTKKLWTLYYIKPRSRDTYSIYFYKVLNINKNRSRPRNDLNLEYANKQSNHRDAKRIYNLCNYEYDIHRHTNHIKMNSKPQNSPQIIYSAQKELTNALEKLGFPPLLFAASSSFSHASSKRSPSRPEWSFSRASHRSSIVRPCL